MNDRELLEMAAKAAGIKFEFCRPEIGGALIRYDKINKWWNPLINDADALRLAVDLGIEIYFEGNEKSESVWANEVMLWTENNRCFATRKAITMAAAEIGRNMK